MIQINPQVALTQLNAVAPLIQKAASGAQQVTNPLSKLLDGAEELTFARAGMRDSSRKLGKAPTELARDRAKQVLAVMAVLSEDNPYHAPGQRLAQSSEDISQMLRRETDDPFEQFLMLAAALESGEADPARIADMEQVLAFLEEDHSVEIRAKAHALPLSQTFGRNRAEAAEFRDAYLDLIMAASIGEALDKLLKRFGRKPYGRRRLRSALYDFIQVLGEEMDSQWMSLERDVLQLLRGRLRDSQGVVTVLEECTALLQRFRARRTLRHYDPVTLTRELLTLAGKTWIMDGRFGEIGGQYIDPTPAEALQFLRRVQGIIRNLPDILFVDAVGRESVMAAIQRELDEQAELEALWMQP